MKIHLATASYPQPVSSRLLLAKYSAAALFIVLALAQLFAFEKMGTVLAAEFGAGSESFAKIVAAILVVLEVAAVPALVNVALSPLARIVSRIAGLIVWPLWYAVIYCGITSNRVVNSGLLGEKINLPAHLVTLLIVMVCFLFVAAVQYMDTRRLSVHPKNAKI